MAPSGCIGGPSEYEWPGGKKLAVYSTKQRDQGPFYQEYLGKFSKQEGPKLPDPRRFLVLRTRQVGPLVVAEIQYPDCDNYEGKKILVYERIKEEDLYKHQRLDPHFCTHRDCESPIARFVPTAKGWEMAISFSLEWQRSQRLI